MPEKSKPSSAGKGDVLQIVVSEQTLLMIEKTAVEKAVDSLWKSCE
jgi:hypothetical protein